MENEKENSSWIRCPICGCKTRTKVNKDTVLIKFPLYCPRCKREVQIDALKMKMLVSNETC